MKWLIEELKRGRMRADEDGGAAPDAGGGDAPIVPETEAPDDDLDHIDDALGVMDDVDPDDGEDEPETPVEDEPDDGEPAENTDTAPQADSGEEAYHRELAERIGLPGAEQMDAVTLKNVLTYMNRVAEQAEQARASGDDDTDEQADTPDSEDGFSQLLAKLDADDDYDPVIVEGLKGFYAELQKVRHENAKLKESFAGVEAEIQQRAQSAQYHEFESLWKGAGEEFAPYIGQGETRTLSPELQAARMDVVEQMAFLADRYSQRGKAVPSNSELLSEALHMTFAKHIADIQRAKLTSSVRSATRTQRPASPRRSLKAADSEGADTRMDTLDELIEAS